MFGEGSMISCEAGCVEACQQLLDAHALAAFDFKFLVCF